LVIPKTKLGQLDLNKIYYLFHRDTNKPAQNVNIAVKVCNITDREITLVTASGDYFYGDHMQRFSAITFDKYFYGKTWHLG